MMSRIRRMHKPGERERCMICGAELGQEPVLRLSDMPASAQDIPSADELSEDKGLELSLYICPDCGLCQFDCEPVPYYPEVIRAVGLSETMRELRRRDYIHMTETYGLTGGRFLECGCGRGEFLEVLSEFPVEIYGTEADPENAAIAAERLGDGIVNMFPEGSDAVIPGAPFDCFLSFNFLEHQPDPVAMLEAMHANLREGGYGLITVPSLEYILEEGYYYEFIRDHIANYDLDSLSGLCRRCGFEVLESGRIGIGDTLRVVVRKAACGSRETAESLRDPHGDPEAIKAGFEKIKTNKENIGYNLKIYTENLKKSGKRLALWGAGHQGFTIASTTVLRDEAEYILDSAAFKQGLYAPASHLPIVAPGYFLTNPVDVIMITAPGYVKEIKRSIEELCASSGAPLPEITDILSILHHGQEGL